MGATYLGEGTLAMALPAVDAACLTVCATLTDLRVTLGAQIDALGAAGIAIRIPAVADFSAQLDAALSISAGFQASLSNPTAYLSSLLDGLLVAQAGIAIAVPTVALNAQLAASAAAAAAATAKIAAVDLELAALVTISGALSAALAAVLDAIGVCVSLSATLSTPGVHVVIYDGALSGLGAAVDAAMTDKGLAPSTTVRAVTALGTGAAGASIGAGVRAA